MIIAKTKSSLENLSYFIISLVKYLLLHLNKYKRIEKTALFSLLRVTRINDTIKTRFQDKKGIKMQANIKEVTISSSQIRLSLETTLGTKDLILPLKSYLDHFVKSSNNQLLVWVRFSENEMDFNDFEFVANKEEKQLEGLIKKLDELKWASEHPSAA